MRTTLTIDDNLEINLRNYANKNSLKFKKVVNDALLIGLNHLNKQPYAQTYKTNPKPVGLKKGLSYDNVAELLEQVEGANYK